MMTDLAKLWLRAVGWYALFTLPALLIPPMYFISMVLAILLACPAVLLFTLPTYCGLWWPASRLWPKEWLYAWVMICVAVGFELLNHLAPLQELAGLNGKQNVWQTGVFLAFPFAALLAGWMACRAWVKSWPYFPYEEELADGPPYLRG